MNKTNLTEIPMPSSHNHSCSLCALSHICLPLGVEKKDIEQLELLVKTSASLHQNDTVFRQGDVFTKVYAVKSGTLKSTHVDKNGNERIIGFHLPGELIGLDGIFPNNYSSSVAVLDTSVLCELDYDKLTELCSAIPNLQRQLLRLFSRDLYGSHISHAENAEQTAIQKLAGFLHNLSARYELRGYSANVFKLAMSRQDIANYLGLTPETVSRLLRRFKQDDIVLIENKHIYIQNPKALNNILHCATVKKP